MRVLDLGCGPGRDLGKWGVMPEDEVTGVDINHARLIMARRQFPERHNVLAKGECLPFPTASFDWVISAVALPYMDIQKTLAELHRILVPGGRLSLSLHSAEFTIGELLHHAIPKPVPTLFRLYVLANGVFFHCTGKTGKFLNHRTESFQTERGMKLALRRAGFSHSSCTRQGAQTNRTFIVEATKL